MHFIYDANSEVNASHSFQMRVPRLREVNSQGDDSSASTSD